MKFERKHKYEGEIMKKLKFQSKVRKYIHKSTLMETQILEVKKSKQFQI